MRLKSALGPEAQALLKLRRVIQVTICNHLLNLEFVNKLQDLRGKKTSTHGSAYENITEIFIYLISIYNVIIIVVIVIVVVDILIFRMTNKVYCCSVLRQNFITAHHEDDPRCHSSWPVSFCVCLCL